MSAAEQQYGIPGKNDSLDIPASVLLQSAPFYASPSFIFWSCMSFCWIIYVWELFLSLREYFTQKNCKQVPTRLKAAISQEEFEKSRIYTLEKSAYGMFVGAISQIELTLILLFNGMPWLWKVSGNLVPGKWGGLGHEILQTMIFLILGQIYQTIFTLPFSYYKTFVIEERHGMNKQTLGFFAWDMIKNFVVFNVVIQNIIVPILIYIIYIGGDNAFFYAWIFCVVTILFISTIYQDYIAPIFDTYKPVPEGSLRDRIETLAKKLRFPLHRLYIVEGSKRSAHGNAYFFGMFGKKTIVLFDTLFPASVESKVEENPDTDAVVNSREKTKENEALLGCTDEEIVAILSHELGHWKMGHFWKNILLSMTTLLVSFAMFGYFYKYDAIFKAFGFYHEKPILIGLVLIMQYLYAPISQIISFGQILLSRRYEFQADDFAKRLNAAEELKGALIKLNKTNKGFPVHDYLYSMFNHSHPTLEQRLEVLDKVE